MQDTRTVATHRIPSGVEDFESFYFPINHNQLRDLLGQVLTQVESMNMAERAERATKGIFTQMLWRWFDEVMENSATSAPHAGLLPIKPPPAKP